MSKKIYKFLILVFLFYVIKQVLFYFIYPDANDLMNKEFDNQVYLSFVSLIQVALTAFIPFLGIWVVERRGFRTLLRENRVTWSGMDKKRAKQLVLMLLGCGFIYFFLLIIFNYCFMSSNRDGIFGFFLEGSIDTPLGIKINYLTLIILLFVMSIVSAFISSLFVFIGLGDEIAWRGYLDRELNFPDLKKYFYIGIYVSMLSIPRYVSNFIVHLNEDSIETYFSSSWFMSVIYMLIMNVLWAIYLGIAVKQTRSVVFTTFIALLVSGFINVFFMLGTATNSFYDFYPVQILFLIILILLTKWNSKPVFISKA